MKITEIESCEEFNDAISRLNLPIESELKIRKIRFEKLWDKYKPERNKDV